MTWYHIMGVIIALVIVLPAYLYVAFKVMGAGFVSGCLAYLDYHKEKNGGYKDKE